MIERVRLVGYAHAGALLWVCGLALGVDFVSGEGTERLIESGASALRWRVVWALWRRHRGCVIAIRRIHGRLRRVEVLNAPAK